MAKKSKRRAWTTTDVRTLKAAARKKTKASRIARSLKRTEGATRQKAFSIGLSLDSRAWRNNSHIRAKKAPPGCGAFVLVPLETSDTLIRIKCAAKGYEGIPW